MRRRVRRENIGVALFPFLAVLICTMGSLIVLLVMIVNQASFDAKAIAAEQLHAAQPSAEELAKQQQAFDDAQWRREMLDKARAEKQEELQNRRLELSHLEDHIRRLDERAKELVKLVEQLKDGKKASDEELAASRNELDKLKQEIAQKQNELEKKKKKAAENEGWYALIPYDGPNGTRRMPIYVECVEEGIVVQPEGVLLSPRDFDGSLGPGNPLDAALRAKREYIMKATGGKMGEPYPLLVVRPSGVIAYQAARAAMKSWDDEFGYELISEEKKLDFGPRDPHLDQLMQKEIAQARKRQAVLAAAMPRQFSREEAVRTFAADEMPGIRSGTPATGGSVGRGGHGGGTGIGGNTSREPGAASNSTSGSGVGGPYGSQGTQLPGGGGINPGDGGGYGSGGTAQGAMTPGGGPSSGSPGAGVGPSTASGGPGTAAQRWSPPGNTSGQPGTGVRAPGGSAGGTNATGSTIPSLTQPGGITSPGQGTQIPGSAGASGPPAVGQGSPSVGMSVDASPQKSFEGTTKSSKAGKASASRKAHNWGLPEAQRHVTGVTRPIRTIVEPHRLVLMPDRGEDARPVEVPLSPEMSAQEVDALVKAVQRQMRSWGIALDGGYWKPLLSVEVGQGAEDRMAELKSVLHGSGIDVQRKLR